VKKAQRNKNKDLMKGYVPSEI